MSRKHFCMACSNNKFGVKTKLAVEHTCGKTEKELLAEIVAQTRKENGVVYSDNGNYYSLQSNSELYPEYGECVMCGSNDMTILDDKDICHSCGYVYT